MTEYKVIGILIKDRIKEARKTQGVLSRYGHIISMRLGTHEVSEDKCSRIGLILLALRGSHEEWAKLEAELNEIGGVEIKNMKFEY